MTFLGDYLKKRLTEATIERSMIIQYVKELFLDPEFPQGVCVALESCTVANKGDVVWTDTDCENPHDFIPLPRIDDLVLNLPSKDEFLRRLGVEKMEDVTAEAYVAFWDTFEFEFAEFADGVTIQWE